MNSTYRDGDVIKKKCRVCGELKPLEEMKKRKSGLYGTDSVCKKCSSRYHMEWRKSQTDGLVSNADDKRHGTSYGYSLGCRCDKCKEAERMHMREYRRRKK